MINMNAIGRQDGIIVKALGEWTAEDIIKELNLIMRMIKENVPVTITKVTEEEVRIEGYEMLIWMLKGYIDEAGDNVMAVEYID